MPGGVNCKGNVYKFPYIQDFLILYVWKRGCALAHKDNVAARLRSAQKILQAKFYCTGFLHLWDLVENLYRMEMQMKTCKICPRECNVDRSGGIMGYCGETMQIRIARTSLHQWEEPCITGEFGSGTVFFSGCSLKCIFCQNHNIADNSVGQTFTTQELADAFLRLQKKKASNINLVTAGHFVEQIIPAIQLAKENGLAIPIVYNSSGYETVESLQKLEGLVDIYLPDCKFFSTKLSKDYAKAEDYFAVASKAIAEMVRQTKEAVFEQESGRMLKGVLVRHLVLPGHTKDSKEIIRYLNETYGRDIFISIMNQYTPVVKQAEFENLNRRVTKREYQRVIDFAIALGIENAFIQEGETAQESFIPEFDCSFI